MSGAARTSWGKKKVSSFQRFSLEKGSTLHLNSSELLLSPPPSFPLHWVPCSHVFVSLKIMEKLLTECDAQRLQLIIDSYLQMLHSMLESTDSDFQIKATDSVRKNKKTFI